MMRQTPALPTMKDAVAHVEAHGTDSARQDVRKARSALAVHGLEGPDFDRFPADLRIFDKRVRKLSGAMPALQRQIRFAGLCDESYKQNRRAARRLIEAVTGEKADKAERKARQDEWSALLDLLNALCAAELVDKQLGLSLTGLIDDCRASHVAPRQLDVQCAASMMERMTARRRKNFRKGLKTLESLQQTPRICDMLPATSMLPPPRPASRFNTLALSLQSRFTLWIDQAAREQKAEEYNEIAGPLTKGTRYSYSAALSLFGKTLIDLGEDLPDGITLQELFEKTRVNKVIGHWHSVGTLADRTYAGYTASLAALLDRNGESAEAAYVQGLLYNMGFLQRGRAADKTMGAKVKRWSQALLNDPAKKTLFQIQHVKFYQCAQEALAMAREKKFDLRILSQPAAMAALPVADRGRAKKLLREARMFGMLAAYTAIALEGAPYRRQNMLSVRHSGPDKTMFVALTGSSPHVTIKFPNEELKNGKWLTRRGETLEEVTIRKRGEGDFGPAILSFYLKEIRPLFPEAVNTHCFFPPILEAKTTGSGLCKASFDLWLSEGSERIGLPLTSHNFRHGYCSIDINDGRRSIQDLAKIMGDTVAVLQRYYAWINARQSVQNVQTDMARRRAEIMAKRARN